MGGVGRGVEELGGQGGHGGAGLLAGDPLKTVVLEFTAARYDDPRAFLDELLKPGFSLERIDYVRGIVPASVDEVLASDPYVDIMLVLRR